MRTDPRILELRRLARANGWQVSSVTAARRRAPIALVASRLYRQPWTPGNMTQNPLWQRLDVNIDAATGAEHGWNRVGQNLQSPEGLDREAIERVLTSDCPATQEANA